MSTRKTNSATANTDEPRLFKVPVWNVANRIKDKDRSVDVDQMVYLTLSQQCFILV